MTLTATVPFDADSLTRVDKSALFLARQWYRDCVVNCELGLKDEALAAYDKAYANAKDYLHFEHVQGWDDMAVGALKIWFRA